MHMGWVKVFMKWVNAGIGSTCEAPYPNLEIDGDFPPLVFNNV